jgi:hypothetical protein
VDRDARAEKQSARCNPTRKKFDSSVDFSLHSAAAGEQPPAFINYELVGEPGEARRASLGVIDAIHFR